VSTLEKPAILDQFASKLIPAPRMLWRTHLPGKNPFAGTGRWREDRQAEDCEEKGCGERNPLPGRLHGMRQPQGKKSAVMTRSAAKGKTAGRKDRRDNGKPPRQGKEVRGQERLPRARRPPLGGKGVSAGKDLR